MNRITLEGKLLFAIAVVGVLTLILTASALLPTYQSYSAAEENLCAVQRFGMVLETVSRISAERGPANDIMSIEPQSSKAAADRLAKFRRDSDLALAALEAPMDADVDAVAWTELDALMWKTKEQLQRARADVDQIANTPLSARRPEDIQLAIGSMISTIDVFQKVTDWYVATLTVHRPSLTAPLLTGRAISDMREYGGRVASQLIGPIAKRQPLEASHLANSGETMGRLLELRQLLQGQRIMSGNDPFATQIMSDVDSIFFGTGLRLVRRMITAGRVSGDYPISSVELTRLYVPTFEPVEKLRAVFLNETIKRYELQHEAAFYRLATITAITLSVMGGLLFLLHSIRLHMLNPLLTARRQIISLADGGGMVSPPPASSVPEMRSLFEALELLQGKLQERSEYEALLKIQAEKDGLTSVWNRRALDAFGQSLSSGKADLCLMLIDIDHFKGINDTYGHLTGDAVLIEIAALLQSAVRSSDIVGRFGGEEFAVLVAHSDLQAVFLIAEKLRGAIHSHSFRHADRDTEVRATASIGIALAGNGPNSWRQVIADADHALYQAKKEGRNRTCIFQEAVSPSYAAQSATR